MIVDGVEGVYGKAPFDTSFMQQVEWDEADLPSDSGVDYSNMRLNLSFGSNVKDITTTEKKIFHYSFDYASNEYYIPTLMWSTPYFYQDDVLKSNYCDANTDIFQVSNTGKVTSSKQTIVDKLQPNTWYHFDFVFDMGTVTEANRTPYKV